MLKIAASSGECGLNVIRVQRFDSFDADFLHDLIDDPSTAVLAPASRAWAAPVVEGPTSPAAASGAVRNLIAGIVSDLVTIAATVVADICPIKPMEVLKMNLAPYSRPLPIPPLRICARHRNDPIELFIWQTR